MLRTHRMKTSAQARRTLAMGLCLGGLLGTGLMPAEAQAGGRTPSPATVVYDLLVERPLGLVELTTGTAILAVAYPIAAAADDGDLVVEHCVRTPGRSTFTRALGRLDGDRRSGCSPVAFGLEMTQLSVGTALKPLSWIFGGSPFSRSRSDDEGIEI
jgi:hypothetical protein